MRFFKGLVGGVAGAVPGMALIPVLEFFVMVVIFLGVIAGAMIGLAPMGRHAATAIGTGIGVVAGVAVALLPGGFGFLLAPFIVVFAGLAGMSGTGAGPRPTAQL